MLIRLLLALAAIIAAALPAAALDAHRIAFKNRCSAELRVAIHHADLDGKWITSGWFALAPGAGQILVPTPDPTFCFIAEAHGRVWHGDDKLIAVRDDPVPYGFQRVDIASQGFMDHLVTLDCRETHDIDPLHNIQVINRCSKPVELYLKFQTMAGLPQVDGWVTLAPMRRAYLGRTTAADYHLSARAEGIEWAGDHKLEVEPGTTLGFERVDAGKIRTLTCD